MENFNLYQLFTDNSLDLELTNNLNLGEIFLILMITLLVSSFIFYIYKLTYNGVLYTQSFNISLVIVSLVTALVIMTISANFILSLGMVGALSIVRFRTAVKDSMDIVYMFWAIGVGIANGAAFFKISIAGSLFIGLSLFLFSKLKNPFKPYLLIINYNNDVSSSTNVIQNLVNENFKKSIIKSQTLNSNEAELTFEVRLKNNDYSKINEIKDLDFISNVVLVSYNGDYIS